MLRLSQAFAISGDVKAGLLGQAQKYPVKRIGAVVGWARAILYLASRQAGFITAEALSLTVARPPAVSAVCT